MMKRFFTLILAVIAVLAAVAANDEVTLIGRVKDSFTKRDLFKAFVKTYDKEGNVTDSIQCKSLSWNGHYLDSTSTFYLQIPRVDSVISLDVICPGYNDKTLTVDLGKIGKRESRQYLPLILMERAPRTLSEVTVTTTKIKFYNKGDTLVYNADAFQLAEGSMLDELIAQLPGAELSDNGQIKVKGQFVESLLLNGKQFMDGNNNLMLENIAAYTVKDIQVYEGQTKLDRQQGNINAPKVLTMDVRLKKEYNYGLVGNFQGGYGTEDRYIGRAFASWFNATTRLSLVGNVNNLNDNRKPGRNDSWTPEKMPSGTKEYRLGGIDYNYEAPDESWSADGSVIFEQSVNNTRRTTSRINFLPGGDTYDYSRSKNRDRETGVRAMQTFYKSFGINKKVMSGLRFGGNYSYQKNMNSDLSATFNKEQQGSVNEILNAMYSDGSADKINDVINRNDTRADGWTKTLNGSAECYFNFNLPGGDDRLGFKVGANYNGVRNELWNDYNVLFNNPEPSVLRRRNYIDNKPNHTMDITGDLRYSTSIGNVNFSLYYSYIFSDRIKDSYMYALDRLNDMGIYGIVPADYLDVFDPANSYESRLIQNRHMFNLGIFYNKSYKSSYLNIRINPQLGIVHRHLDYWRDGRDYRYSRTNTTLTVATIFDSMIEYGFHKKKASRRGYRNVVRYSYRVNPRLPEVEDLIDIVNDADPMNIYYGNPNLKTQIAHAHLFRWAYTPESHTLENYLYIGYNHTTNSLTRGYTYDTATGVRYNRMYNVNGNNRAAITNELSMQFGAKKQFTLSSTTDIVSSNSTDMIGTNAETPELVKVHQNSFSENVRVGWQIGKQTLQVRCDYTTRHTTSTRPDFETLNAYHVNYGVSGIFSLPAGFGVSTDFMCYTRRGYGSAQLDTTDPVWNARLTFSPVRNNHWVFNLDGFDLLHKLSNVTYAVTASGRTVAYTNALPRYVLATVQYRFSIQPKR